jgi:hypothetical protein
MAQFAEHCRAKFQLVVLDLEKVLGPDTADLKTRTGVSVSERMDIDLLALAR